MLIRRPEDRRRARQAILAVLDALQPEDRSVVLEDILVELHDENLPGLEKIDEEPVAAAPRASIAPPPPPPKLAAVPSSMELWRRIEEHCLAHPSPKGIFDFAEVGAALYPDWKPAKRRQWIYITVLRKSPQTDRGTPRHPRFEMAGGGFQLLRHDTNGFAAAPAAPGHSRIGRPAVSTCIRSLLMDQPGKSVHLDDIRSHVSSKIPTATRGTVCGAANRLVHTEEGFDSPGRSLYRFRPPKPSTLPAQGGLL